MVQRVHVSGVPSALMAKRGVVTEARNWHNPLAVGLLVVALFIAIVIVGVSQANIVGSSVTAFGERMVEGGIPYSLLF